jgi:hypothetical protein
LTWIGCAGMIANAGQDEPSAGRPDPLAPPLSIGDRILARSE